MLRQPSEIKIDNKTLAEILADHKEWLKGTGGVRVYLRDVNLKFVNLKFADLTCGHLNCVNFTGANLAHANFTGASLAHANFTGAIIRNATLTGASMRGAKVTDMTIPAIPNIHQAVFRAASAEDALDMVDWHSCGNTHCWAGWVVTLAGVDGKALEEALGTSVAAALILEASDPKLKAIPDFFSENDEAIESMKRLAEQEAA